MQRYIIHNKHQLSFTHSTTGNKKVSWLKSVKEWVSLSRWTAELYYVIAASRPEGEQQQNRWCHVPMNKKDEKCICSFSLTIRINSNSSVLVCDIRYQTVYRLLVCHFRRKCFSVSVSETRYFSHLYPERISQSKLFFNSSAECGYLQNPVRLEYLSTVWGTMK